MRDNKYVQPWHTELFIMTPGFVPESSPSHPSDGEIFITKAEHYIYLVSKPDWQSIVRFPRKILLADSRKMIIFHQSAPYKL